ncbi:MAG: hypothetical protein ACREMA_08475 [Longimicrobiales bacterium]
MSAIMDVVAVDDGRLARFAEFLSRMTPARAAQDIEKSYRYPWLAEKPNYGYMLVEADNVCGVLGAIYSERDIRGAAHRFCNLADWYVQPEYRGDSMSLIFAALSQRGYTFTSVSHTRQVATVLRALGFKPVAEHALLIPLPVLRSGGGRVTEVTNSLARQLDDSDRRIFEDLAVRAGCSHLWLEAGADSCYCVLRTVERRRIRFVVPLYVSNPAVFRRALPVLRQWILARLGVQLMLSDARWCSPAPLISIRLRDPRPLLFRSRSLPAGDIDALYSELTL